MSLLLDALKKSGHSQNASTDGNAGQPASSGLTLEELPSEPAAGISRSEPERDAGKNLFAAKKTAPAKRREMKLGIVPITLIGATLFGSGYGYYVWREIQPRPIARPIARPALPPSATAAAPQQNIALNSVPPVQPTQTTQPAEAEIPPMETVHVQTPEKPSVSVHHRASRKPRQTRPFSIESTQRADTITPLLEAGYRAYRSGDFAVAQQNYSRVLRQDDKNRDALLGMAAIAQQQGNDTVAAQYYGQVLVLDPRDPLAQAGMSALEKGGPSSDKESRLKLLLDQQPQSAALNFALGNLYAEQSRWTEAQQAYFTAYSLQPDAAQYAYNLAVSLDHLGQAKLAAQYYQRALQLDNSGSPTIDHAQAQQRLSELQAH
jgi:tetratricopeptide (TPR) repeat protein